MNTFLTTLLTLLILLVASQIHYGLASLIQHAQDEGLQQLEA